MSAVGPASAAGAYSARSSGSSRPGVSNVDDAAHAYFQALTAALLREGHGYEG